ncbi:MAG: amidohydrolase family protein [Anaerolineales bacterium]|nr:amidohydrolase family protein [Anaerolineales bacterium]
MRLPGLTDPHVHVRDLQQSHKEDWFSATAAALAGGVTTILAMPNTQPPLVDEVALTQYEVAARARAACDYGIYFGAGPGNVGAAAGLASRSVGLKLYLDATFGDLKMSGLDALVAHCAAWPKDRPLVAHAEEQQTAAVILAAHLAGRSVHVCHVARESEIALIRSARERGLAVTCEVCPHHLFLIEGARPARQFEVVAKNARGWSGAYAEVRPRLQTQADVDALWTNLDVIDCFATDHAPHTITEKESTAPPPGFPGLETALPLWLTAVHAGLLDLDDVIARMHAGPRRIFNLPEQPATWVDLDAEATWQPIGAEQHTRAAWTPFEGWALRGRVTAVTLRGERVYDSGQILAQPGFGHNVVG